MTSAPQVAHGSEAPRRQKKEEEKCRSMFDLTDSDVDVLLMGGAATMICVAAGFRTIYGALMLFMVLYTVLRFFWRPHEYPLEVRGHRGLTLEQESKRMKLTVLSPFEERLELIVTPAGDKVIDIKLAALLSSQKAPSTMTELDVDLLWGEIPLDDDKSITEFLGECTRPRCLELRSKMDPPGTM